MHLEVWEAVSCTVLQPWRRTSGPFLPNTGYIKMEMADIKERSLKFLAALEVSHQPVLRPRMTGKRSFWAAGLMKAR